MIYEKLTAVPGMNRNQLRESLELPLGVLDFHLDKLVEAEVIVRRPSMNDKEILLFTDENMDLWEDPHTRTLYGSEFTRNVALYIYDNPGVRTVTIADDLDLEPVTIRYHINKLAEHDLVGSIQAGRRIEYHPSSRLRSWAKRLGDRFDRPWEEDVSGRQGQGEDGEEEPRETAAAEAG